jgi:hypothetical protein
VRYEERLDVLAVVRLKKGGSGITAMMCVARESSSMAEGVVEPWLPMRGSCMCLDRFVYGQ